MKKCFVIVLLFLLVFSFASCIDDSSDDFSSVDNSQSTQDGNTTEDTTADTTEDTTADTTEDTTESTTANTTVNTTENKPDEPKPITYEQALDMIADGKYEDAYYILLSLKKNGNEQAREKLKDFHVVVSKKSIAGLFDTTVYEYTYDDNGNIIKIKKTSDGEQFNPSIYTNTYDENGCLIKQECFNGPDYGTVREYSYIQNGRLISEMSSARQHSDTLYYTYTYDSLGRVASKTTRKEGHHNGTPEYFTYDEYGRLLKTSKEPTRDYGVVLYTYDNNGNLIKKVEHPNWTDQTDYKYSYDENGYETLYDMSTIDGRIYSYSQSKNTYDSNGNLIKKVSTDKHGGIINSQEYEGYLIFYRPGNPLNELPNVATTIPSK